MGLRDLLCCILCCIRKPASEDERSHFSEEEVKKPISSRKPASEGEGSHFIEEEVKKPISSRKPASEGERSHFSEEEVKKPISSEEKVKDPIFTEEKVKEEEVKDSIFSKEMVKKPIFREENVKNTIFSKEKSFPKKNPTDDSSAIFSKEKKNSTDYSSANYFLLPAKELSIAWGDDKRYWQWLLSGGVDVAELREVCKFEVQGKFETRKLSPETTYQVFFLLMLKKGASGFEDPVNLRLVLPDGQKQEGKESLMNLKKDEWIELQVGEFYMSNEIGQIQFSMFEHNEKWKRGLVVKGVVIRTKK